MKYVYFVMVILVFTIFGCGKSPEMPAVPEVDINTPTEEVPQETPVTEDITTDENIAEIEEAETTVTSDEEDAIVAELEEVDTTVTDPTAG